MRDQIIFFSNSKGHALLSYIVKKAYKNGKPIGRTHIQKIPYVLKAIEIPVPYIFELYFYGPYCQDIVFAIDDIIADDVIKDESKDAQKHSRFTPGPNVDKLIERYNEYLTPRIKKKIDKVVEIFSSWSTQNLELFTTLHYVYRKEKAIQGCLPRKNDIISAFKKAKDKFSDNDITDMLDLLIEIDFIKIEKNRSMTAVS